VSEGKTFTDKVFDVDLVGDDNGKPGWIYFILCADAKRCKIGFTRHDVSKRLANLQTGSASELCLLVKHPGSMESERILHARFAADRVQGEWFNVSEDIRAYLLAAVMAMAELTIRGGGKLEPWLYFGLRTAFDQLDSLPEGLIESLEAGRP
jgi:hypothetical protein